MVVPSCAVTTVVIVLLPAESEIAPLAVPDATVVPLTLIEAVESATIGVTVIEVVAVVTLAV